MVQWMCTDFVIQLVSQKADKKNCYLRCQRTVTSSYNMTMLGFKWSDIQCTWWQFNSNQNTKGMLSVNIIIVDAILIFVYCRPVSTKHLKSTVHLKNPSSWTVLLFFLLVTAILSVYGSRILMSINGIWLKKFGN